MIPRSYELRVDGTARATKANMRTMTTSELMRSTRPTVTTRNADVPRDAVRVLWSTGGYVAQVGGVNAPRRERLSGHVSAADMIGIIRELRAAGRRVVATSMIRTELARETSVAAVVALDIECVV